MILKLILLNVLLGFLQFLCDPYYEPTTVVHDYFAIKCLFWFKNHSSKLLDHLFEAYLDHLI